MQSLPYKAKVIIVSDEMCDHNGHMNVNYYYKLFDSVYTAMYYENLGFDDAYLASGFSTFTLEDSIRYLKEFKLDDQVYPHFILLMLIRNFFPLLEYSKMKKTNYLLFLKLC